MEKNRHAEALGRLGGLKGGVARAASLSAERRSEIARLAALTRWSGVRPEEAGAERSDMAKGSLYEYAIIFHPRTIKDVAGNDTTKKSVLVVPVTQIVALSPEEVQMVAARSIPEDYLDKLEQVEIVARPFGSA